MREIKFRAWDKKNKEWFYFGLNEVYGMGQDSPNGYAEINFDEIMQYTGLKDKNNKEIYEGDILKFNTKGGNEMIYEVKWRGKGFKPTRMSEDNQEEIEIIGNIYENTELLSGN